jgi:DNA-binding MarR family transcriptional regulator
VSARRHKAIDVESRQNLASDRRVNGGLSLGPLAEFIGFHLRLAQDASFRTFAGRSGIAHLKPGRFAAMMLVRSNPGITQIELSRGIGRDKSSVTSLVQELHRQGLVARTPSAEDGRSMTLTLTRSGEAALDALLVHARHHERQLDRILGARKAAFIAVLKKIADASA